MHNIPLPIVDVLSQYSVLSLSVCHDDIPGSASAFYAFDPSKQRLIVLSALDTEHGRMMSLNPSVAGTVSGQFTDITQIHGLQFLGTARLLDSPARCEPALETYYQRFPQARGMLAPVWDIHLMQLKLTDNRLGFGTKLRWNRHDGTTSPASHCTASHTTKTSP